MTSIIVWVLAVSLGYAVTYATAGNVHAISSIVAALIVICSFQISQFFKVAGSVAVSKMGTAWLTQELRRMAWRVAMTLVMAGVAFKLAWPQWGVAFWLCVAVYYQVGLVLHLRDIRRQASQATN